MQHLYYSRYLQSNFSFLLAVPQLSQNTDVQQKCKEIDNKRISKEEKTEMINFLSHHLHSEMCKDTTVSDNDLQKLVENLKSTFDNLESKNLTIQQQWAPMLNCLGSVVPYWYHASGSI